MNNSNKKSDKEILIEKEIRSNKSLQNLLNGLGIKVNSNTASKPKK